MTEADVMTEWGVILKVRVLPDEPSPTREQLDRLTESLPGPPGDKRLTGGGRDFTAWFWADAHDASEAIDVAYSALRGAADKQRIGRFQIIRAHSADHDGRTVEVYPATHERASLPDAWSAQLKLEAPGRATLADDALLGRFLAALPDANDAAISLHGDPVKFLGDDGSGFTIRFWVKAGTAEDALRSSRGDALGTLKRLQMDGWSLVRAHLATAEERSQDDFPGSARRHAEESGRSDGPAIANRDERR